MRPRTPSPLDLIWAVGSDLTVQIRSVGFLRTFCTEALGFSGICTFYLFQSLNKCFKPCLFAENPLDSLKLIFPFYLIVFTSQPTLEKYKIFLV